MIPGLVRLSYDKRLKKRGLCALERRWLEGDMVEIFKIIKGIDIISAEELFSRIDSNTLRIKKRRVKIVVRQGSFTQRVINAWNGLP